MGSIVTPLSAAGSGFTDIVNQANSLASLLKTPPFSALSLSGNDIMPVKSQGAPNRISIPGEPTIGAEYHKLMTQGQFLEASVGGAMHALQAKTIDLQEKIEHYMSLNRLGTTTQLPHVLREPKAVKDCVSFLKRVMKYAAEIEDLITALQANINMVNGISAQMTSMISQNLTALSNLLYQICNWHIPKYPSLAALEALLFHWPGFQFASKGFKFNPMLNFKSMFSFSFAECSIFPMNTPSGAAAAAVASLSNYGLTFIDASVGVVSVPTSTMTPAQMQSNTTTPVFNPATYQPTTTSLPDPASIISNYQLDPATYAANIVSVVPALQPAVIQPDSPDYLSASISASSLNHLQQLLTSAVTLAEVVASDYDPNLTAAWLFYLQANRAGRLGSWISTFQTAYAAYITPSLSYLADTPVPWNDITGSVADAPLAIPLIATLKAASNQTEILWQLSYLEASLLGYLRTTTWDTAADATFTSGFTGTDLDFTAATIALGTTTTIQLGTGTATYPVSCTYPQAIAANLEAVIALATVSITSAATYQSPRPQNRFIYNEFAEAAAVDKYSQFWRDFNSYLITQLASDPYVFDRVASYVASLDGAINPLASVADGAAYESVIADSNSRNRAWTPGSDLLPLPKMAVTVVSAEGPSAATNGWTTGTFDAAAFLQRPDIQSLPIPQQIAMLRTNQGFSSLQTLQTQVNQAISDSLAQAQVILDTVPLTGWGVSNSAAASVPSTGMLLPMDTTSLNMASFVTDFKHITVSTAGVYALSATVEWDTTGAAGTRTVALILNGAVSSAVSAGAAAGNPFETSIATMLSLNVGDVLSVQVAHDLPTNQNVLAGCEFVGILDPDTAASDLVVSNVQSGANAFIAGAAMAALVAVSIQPDGTVKPLSTEGAAPSVDGVTLAAAASGASVSVGTMYGTPLQVPGASFTVGNGIYAGADGTLTQDFASLTGAWIVYVGRATETDTFLFQPHIPTPA